MKDPFPIKRYETEALTFYQKNKHEIFLWGGIALVLIIVAVVFVKCGPDQPVKGIVKTDKEITTVFKSVVDSKKVDSLLKSDSLKGAQVKNATAHWKEFERKYNELAAKHAYEDFINDDTPTDHTAADYIQSLKDGANTSDSACNAVVIALSERVIVKDSITVALQSDKKILISSFNDMAYNSIQKDKAIKSLNKSLRWQKVQKVGLFVAAGYLLFKVLTK